MVQSGEFPRYKGVAPFLRGITIGERKKEAPVHKIDETTTPEAPRIEHVRQTFSIGSQRKSVTFEDVEHLKVHITDHNVKTKKTLRINFGLFEVSFSLKVFRRQTHLDKSTKKLIKNIRRAKKDQNKVQIAFKAFLKGKPGSFVAKELTKMFDDPNVDGTVKQVVENYIVKFMKGGAFGDSIESRKFINGFMSPQAEKEFLLDNFCKEKNPLVVVEMLHEGLKVSTFSPEKKGLFAQEIAQMLSTMKGYDQVTTRAGEKMTTTEYWKTKLAQPDAGYSFPKSHS